MHTWMNIFIFTLLFNITIITKVQSKNQDYLAKFFETKNPDDLHDNAKTFLTVWRSQQRADTDGRQFQIDYACQLWTSTTIFILLHQIHHASHFYVYTLTGPMFRKEFQKFICHYKNTNHKENLNDFPRRATIMSPQTNHEDTDDQRLGVFLRQTRSFSRLSFKTDV
ncbi:unnamed protein product [Rotaria sp. Silwood1]|nr:unnamed protein product [Rotaria sp. Silwood1]